MSDLINKEQAIKELSIWEDNCRWDEWFSEHCPDDGPVGVIKQLPAINTGECFGYDLEALIAFAEACRRAGVENQDLKEFANNCSFAFDTMRSEFCRCLQKGFEEVLEQLEQYEGGSSLEET